jgi:hypothetical protein
MKGLFAPLYKSAATVHCRDGVRDGVIGWRQADVEASGGMVGKVGRVTGTIARSSR